MGYEVIHARARGASHVKAGTPCEDYGLAGDYGHAKVFVVSDGHGDRSCPRSDVGSRLVCEIAQRELVSFASQMEEMDMAGRESGAPFTSHLLEEGDGDRENRIRHLIVSIVGQWANEIDEDLSASPLSDEERSGCSPYYLDLYDKGERLEHIYGATLIAGLMTERYLLLVQQGDGRCDVFYEDASVTQPIPWDSRCTANVTTSLCDEDAVASARYCVIDLSERPVMAVLAGSDGVEDAFFSMDGTHNFYRGLLLRAAETSVADLQAWLTDYLPGFSREGVSGYGSQDDVTICGFIDCEKVRGQAEKLKTDWETVSLQTKLKTVQDRLDSMETGKLEYLQKRLANAVKAEKEAKEDYDSITGQLEDQKKKHEAFQSMASADRLTVSRGDEKWDLTGKLLKVLKELFYKIVKDTARNICILEANLPEAEKRYREAHALVEPARRELQEYTERKKSLESQRDQYQRELDGLVGAVPKAGDCASTEERVPEAGEGCDAADGEQTTCESAELDDTLEIPIPVVDQPQDQPREKKRFGFRKR